MYPAVIAATPREDFTLLVSFASGESGVLDLKPVLGFGVFQRLRDYAQFCQVRVAFDTVEWPCGVDLDPEYVYAKCQTGMSA